MTPDFWQIVGHSVLGTSHIERAQPNQDAIYWSPTTGTGERPILSISDGHGSPRHFRSETGSRLAVESTVAVLDAFYQSLTDPANLAAVEQQAKARLPKLLTDGWRQAVASHLSTQPISEEEWKLLTSQVGSGAIAVQKRIPELAYGATLLAVLASEAFLLCVQLGDGDMLCVADSGETTRPFDRDRRYARNQTASLCLEDATEEVRIRLISSPLPALVMLSTDGYANSFRTEADFDRLGRWYLDSIRSDGLAQTAQSLPEILEEVTRLGSGDDITLGLMLRKCSEQLNDSSPDLSGEQTTLRISF